MTPEDRAEVEAIVQAGIAAALAVTSEALDELPADATDADVAEAVDELGDQIDAITEAVAEDVEDAVDDAGGADSVTDPTGNDDDLPDAIEDPLAEAGVDLAPPPEADPVVEVAGVAPVIEDTAPDRVHPYWRPLRRR